MTAENRGRAGESPPETIEGPDGLGRRKREAVEALLWTLADDEFVVAERYVDWQVRGPTLEADVAIANIAQDEYGHARLWYDLLEGFGYAGADRIWERPPDDFRHATLPERPFEAGDWADAVVRGYLYDSYEHLLLSALCGSAYAPIRDRVAKVRREESYHREHATNWLERLAAEDAARDRLQAALDRLYPHALTLFEPTDREASIVDLGIRPEPLPSLRRAWVETTTPFLDSLGLVVPDPDATPLPTDGDRTLRGRDGSHTAAWRSLHDELTYTRELLDREPASDPADGSGTAGGSGGAGADD